jgi:hypothetical protein
MHQHQNSIDLLSGYHTTVGLLGGGKYGDNSFNTTSGFPPWLAMPPGSEPFDYVQNVIIPVALGTTSTIFSFTVENGYDGVIKRFYHNYLGAAFVEGSGDLIWSITADGRPIKNFGAMLTSMGNSATPRVSDGIRVFAGQTISYNILHAANPLLTDQVVASLAGYFYPRQS